MLRFFIFMFGVLAKGELAQDAVVVGPEYSISRETEGNPQQCVQDMINWCRNQQFPPGAFVSTSSYDSRLGTRVSCTADSTNGEVCMKNDITWFRCFPNNTLIYKGAELNDGNNQADDEVCTAKEFSSRILITEGTTDFNETAFDLEMEEFHQRMREFQEHMDAMSRNFADTFRNFGTGISDVFN